jgi:hypothetical protein
MDRACVAVVACACVLNACAWSGSQASDPDTVAELLWTPTAARLEEDAARPMRIKSGRSIYVDGTGAVTFTVVGECDVITRDITDHFNDTQWRRRSRQDLNPQFETSFESGCQPYGGGLLQLDTTGRPVPRGPYYRWHGEWENENGDVLTYMLGGEDRQWRGHATYVPRPVIEERRRRLAR